jgi:predicted ATP-grasp superfamily ATP-dependent carboligase
MIAADTSVPVVVLNAYTHCSLAIIRSLGRVGIPVYAVHQTRKAPALRSKYCRGVFELSIEEASQEVAVESLQRIAKTVGGRPLLIPTEDASCVFVEDNSDALRESYRFPKRPDGLAQGLSSKREMYNLCKRFDVPTPEAMFPESREDVARFARTAVFPLMVKPVDNREVQDLPGAGKAVVSTGPELLDLFDRFGSGQARPNLVLQEYIPGGAESVWMFNGYFNADSACLVGITGKKLRQYPPYVGQTSLGVCEPNRVVDETTRRFMRAIGYTGILDIGYRYDARDGKYKLLDVNPRLGAAFRLFVADNGLDVARALYLDMTGQPVREGGAVRGRKWFVENYDLVASLKYRRDGLLSIREWSSSFHGVRESAWFAADDLRPFGAMSIASAKYLAGRRSHAQRAWWRSRAPEEENARSHGSSAASVVSERGQLNGNLIEPSTANR